MKKYYLILLASTFALSACGNTMTMSSTDQLVSGVYTVGALTFEAQAQASAFASTPLPAPTSTLTPAPTMVPPNATPTSTLSTDNPITNHTSGLMQNSDEPIQVDHSLCDSSAYIDDITIPDGTVLAPGETFVKTWTLENTGFCMWKANYVLTFFEGDSMSGLDSEIEKTIASGRQANISIELTAPDSEGTYTSYWILADEYGNRFGMPFYVQIIVNNE